MQESGGGDMESSPMMFCLETGFLKKMTEATMTMTLFRQLPMECVTGETLWRIMYETCDVCQHVER